MGEGLTQSLRTQVFEAILTAMADLDVSSAELAHRLHVSRPAITQMLKHPRNFELATLEKIGHVLGIRWMLIPATSSYRTYKWRHKSAAIRKER